ncbi:MAG: SPOR domain-containing protein [Betaproteobacteria bacterium]
MRGKHRVSRSIGVAVATVAVCGVALLLGYAMGNYAITAITAVRHKTSPAAPPAPAAEPLPVSPEPSASGVASQPGASASQPAADDSRLLTQLQDGTQEASAPASTPAEVPTADRVPAAPLYRVHLGPFATRQEAVAVAGRLLADGYPTYVLAERPYRVQVGAFSRRETAVRLVSELKAKKYSNVRLIEP